MTIQRVLAVLLIALTPVHWWALVVLIRAIRRNPEIHALRAQLTRLLPTAGAALALGIVSANFLLRGPLPTGAGFALLILTLLLISGPPVAFLLDYHRRRRPL